MIWVVRGLVVRVVDFESLAPHRCGFESHKELWITSCEEAIQLPTSVVLLKCPLKSSSTSKVGKSPYITLTELVRRQTQPKNDL